MKPISGPRFKQLRETLGYTVAELAQHLRDIGAPITTERSIYRMQAADVVAERYVEALRSLAGDAAFERVRGSIEQEPPARSAGARTRSPGAASQRRYRNQEVEDQRNTFITFLNSLPVATSLADWVGQLREALREFFDDVDRVTINVNYTCSLVATSHPGTNMIVTEHATPGGRETIVRVTAAREEEVPSVRLLQDFRRNGYRIDEMWPPEVEDYYFGESYLGSIFLWRDRSKPRISVRTAELFKSLAPFMTFLLTDAVARHHHAKPFDQAFDDALANMRREARLGEQESRVVILLLTGHSYKQIAERLAMSVDGVAKHIQNVYRKTGTHSSTELFARYFAHRIGP